MTLSQYRPVSKVKILYIGNHDLISMHFKSMYKNLQNSVHWHFLFIYLLSIKCAFDIDRAFSLKEKKGLKENFVLFRPFPKL